MITPFTMRAILPTSRPVFLRMVKLTMSVPPLEIRDFKLNPTPVPITKPPKIALTSGSVVSVISGTIWMKNELMETVIRVKTVNLWPILYQAKINSGKLMA